MILNMKSLVLEVLDAVIKCLRADRHNRLEKPFVPPASVFEDALKFLGLDVPIQVSLALQLLRFAVACVQQYH